jgi:hypothetical protein
MTLWDQPDRPGADLVDTFDMDDVFDHVRQGVSSEDWDAFLTILEDNDSDDVAIRKARDFFRPHVVAEWLMVMYGQGDLARCSYLWGPGRLFTKEQARRLYEKAKS